MALTANLIYETGGKIVRRLPVKSGVTIYPGALTGMAYGGYLTNWNGSASYNLQGIALGGADAGHDYVTGVAAGTQYMGVDCSGMVLEQVSVTGLTSWEQVTALVYASDENTFTLASTTAGPVGYISYWYSGSKGQITLFTPEEFAIWWSLS